MTGARRIPAFLALVTALLGAGVALAAPASAATVTTTLRAGISGLPVATEVRTGHSRDKFTLWPSPPRAPTSRSP